MVEAKDELRGVELDEPIYEDGMTIVQPVAAEDDDTLVIQNEGEYVAATIPHLVEIVEEGEAEFPGKMFEGRVEDGQIVLESEDGHVVRTPEAEAFVDSLGEE